MTYVTSIGHISVEKTLVTLSNGFDRPRVRPDAIVLIVLSLFPISKLASVIVLATHVMSVSEEGSVLIKLEGNIFSAAVRGHCMPKVIHW